MVIKIVIFLVLVALYIGIFVLGRKGIIDSLNQLFENENFLKIYLIGGFAIFTILFMYVIYPSILGEPKQKSGLEVVSGETVNNEPEQKPTNGQTVVDPNGEEKTKIENKLKKKSGDYNENLSTSPMTEEEKMKAEVVSEANEENITNSMSSDPSKKYFTEEIGIVPLESYKEDNFGDKDKDYQMSYGKGIWKNEMCYFIKEKDSDYSEDKIKIYPSNIVTVKTSDIKDIQPTVVKYYEVIQTGMNKDEPLFMKRLLRLQLNVPSDTKIVDMDLDNGQIQDKNAEKKRIEKGDGNQNEISKDSNNLGNN